MTQALLDPAEVRQLYRIIFEPVERMRELTGNLLFLAIAFLPHRVCGCSGKDDAMALSLPPSS